MSNPQPWTVNQLGVWGLATFTALCLISEAISADQSRAAADISSALQERFNMTPKEVESALASQSEAIAVDQILKEELGEAYAGAWFDDDAGMLAVAFTKAELRSAVSAAGALPVLVSHSLEDFQAASKRLIEIFHGSQFNSSIAGWHVDAEANQLVLEVLDLQDAARSQIQAYLAANGIEASLLRLDESITRAAFLNDIRGGDPADNAPRQRTCSVGFSVDGGFTFAGHCGWGNDNVTGHNSQTMGTLAASSFPPVVYSEPGVPDLVESNRDVAWVSANSSWTPVGEINPYDGLNPILSGSTDGYVNAYVCRYGQTTDGPHCGRIQSMSATRYIWEPTISNTVPVAHLIKVDACADVGDSGGPLVQVVTAVWHVYAVGMTVAGDGGTGCPVSPGQHTYYSSINYALDQFNLDLL